MATITAATSGYARYQEFRGNDFMEFTERELSALNKLVEAWAEYVFLPQEHPSDLDEFRKAIHEAQLLILARPGRRVFNADKPNVSGPYIKKLETQT